MERTSVVVGKKKPAMEIYETQSGIYRNIFRAFACALRNTPARAEARERLDVMANFCEWVAEHKVHHKTSSDLSPELLMDGRWESYEDIAAMVEYINNPKRFTEWHKKTFAQFIQEMKKGAVQE